MRGKVYFTLTDKSELGSPPRMRGKALFALNPDDGRRITPAHAGKSIMKEYSRVRAKDHPRACGEKLHKARLFQK